ncbi:MAG: beta-propeller domain-containing protein [Peptostreptococcaceae bacterium]|nr:beta-propeller domain-containing protein [Peptostreptococcaceae bacterium]
MKKFLVLTLIASIICCFDVSVFASDATLEDSIALHIGSPLILSGEIMKALDSDNPNVVPVIHKDRTLVPLRAISEHFGADVGYEAELREAYIEYGGKRFVFPIDKSNYRIEEYGRETVTIAIDTEALIIQDRTMVPLRVICEDVLGKKVGYGDRVITVGNEEIDLDSKMVDGIKNRIGQALKVSSREELAGIVAGMTDNYEMKAMDEARAPDGMGEALNESAASEDFSATNEQVAGVNEADIVKTDGKYIYVVTGESVRVYDSNNGKPVLTDEIKMTVDAGTGQYIQFSEMYIDDGRLVVLGSRNRFENWIRPIPEPMEEMESSIMPFRDGRSYVWCGIYSIDESGKADLIKEIEVEGSMISSRKKDDAVYLVVNKYLYGYGIDYEEIVPMFRDTALGDEYRELPIDRIMYYPKRAASNYLIVAAIDIFDETKAATIEAFLGSGNMVYMSDKALYVAGQDYNSFWGSITNIAKFTVDGTKIGFAGGGMVEGSVLNQFSMDEYEGSLRVATTNWQRENVNALYVLDENLNETGSVENLAPGERIYSVRFMGDKGYIVTFRQIDPLFVLDLADSDSPRITGELKVPGFSSYLHPLSEDLILGIGQNIDEKTGSQEGIKLSVFDVSDEGKPMEISNLILGGRGSYAEVLYNHKALMLNLKDDMIAFDAVLANNTGDYSKSNFYGAAILKIREDGDMSVLKLISNEGMYGSYVKRAIYIGDILYYILDDNIRAFDIETFDEIK